MIVIVRPIFTTRVKTYLIVVYVTLAKLRDWMFTYERVSTNNFLKNNYSS